MGNGGQPRWWRRFKRLMTAQDLMVGRKVVIQVRMDDGTVHHAIEVVRGVENA